MNALARANRTVSPPRGLAPRTRSPSHTGGRPNALARAGAAPFRRSSRGALPCRAAPTRNLVTELAAMEREGAPPQVDYRYWRLWVGADGHTHCTQSRMGDFEMRGYSAAPQAIREAGIPAPEKLVFTQLPADFDNPWHFCPAPQFVMVQKGSWWVRTTDGKEVVLGTEDLLYQDNTSAIRQLLEASSLAEGLGDRVAQHYSGCGPGGCQQIIVQVDRRPRIEEAEPF